MLLDDGGGLVHAAFGGEPSGRLRVPSPSATTIAAGMALEDSIQRQSSPTQEDIA
jgi:hypothetical protein